MSHWPHDQKSDLSLGDNRVTVAKEATITFLTVASAWLPTTYGLGFGLV